MGQVDGSACDMDPIGAEGAGQCPVDVDFEDLSGCGLSMVFENLASYSCLHGNLYSLRVCMTSAQDLDAFIVSVENSCVIVIGLPLYFLDIFC